MKTQTAFAPLLKIDNGTTDVSFYKNAFGANEHFCVTNDDGSIHVVELDIDGALFHLHEQMPNTGSCPHTVRDTTVTIGLMADDVHAVFDRAVAAGATIMNPVTDYEYGYRQGDLKDPFGHVWTIQKIL
jgi:PhnB protein